MSHDSIGNDHDGEDGDDDGIQKQRQELWSSAQEWKVRQWW